MRTGRSFRLAAVAGIAIACGLAAAADPAGGPGDPSRGRDLFIGSTPFQNGGAPCGACHAIGGERAAFGAALGPELSSTFAGMTPVDMDPILEALPFPSMEPLYAGRPLDPAERADLAAFLARAAGVPPPGAGAFLAWSAAGAALLLALVALVSLRRRGSLREELRARALPTHGRSR
jgi:hypothetical protein